MTAPLPTATADLARALRAERAASYGRLRGGYPVPLAGALWWAALGAAGWLVPSPGRWILAAFVTSGTIFPLALLLARLLRVDFMRDRTAVSDALVPAFASMLLFWPIAVAAWWSHPPLVPLVLAIGMSIHWPVIGWTYARTGLFTAHAVVRAVACFAVWQWLPAHRFTVLPLVVSAVYLATVLAILADTARTPARAAAAAPA
ncbi:hypothetical protein [Roseisolibacter sp. H3M3-2]|uniref:DUF7010 family protein n=1 Tax=Roseisolibacter sp. H3M3-2 TaxID=3031323 RepID=UPI0023D98436|nr:hypothetical protein [Roseisolibacter sp. H3M3-2]MDF1504710.1 hypothetical protein [Roseisolibacter sp. H3M3-2]